jgi:NitT/TauT family transport system substrate-binding protein
MPGMLERHAASFLVAASLLAAAGAPALAVDKVSLRLDYVIGALHAPIFLARDKGFFAKEGIEVEIMPGQGSTVTVKLVGNGSTDFGYAAADQVLLAYAKGLPVMTTAVILQKNPVAMIFPTASGIKSLTDLYGKTIGVPMLSVGEKQWRAVERINNIDDSKIKQVPVDRNIAALIEAGKIDASVAFFFVDGLQPVAHGMPMSWILFADVGLPIYSTSLLVNGDLAGKNPDLVRRFTRAFVAGWVYSIDHQDEALQNYLKNYPTSDVKYATMQLPEVLKITTTPDTIKNGIGHSTLESWEAMQKALVDMGIMEAAVDVRRVFTNEFLK